ncbi:MAG: YeaH/YhbH family protein, partial [Dongiaceae bacterium]
VDQALKSRKLSDLGEGGSVRIPASGIDEPRLRPARSGGRRHHVLPGNEKYLAGDRIAKPELGQGDGRGEASDGGDGQDEFVFALNREEFLDLIFDDLELPNLAKLALTEINTERLGRAGYTTAGTQANLNMLRTLRNSMGRRLSLKRPATSEIERLEQEIEALENLAGLSPEVRTKLDDSRIRLAELERRRRWVPYIDPIDIRYNNFQPRPEPKAQAVMFCLMDVSGSMGEREKDLAKRFFILLHLFLQRRYDRVDLVFVRHTHEAEEVDEEAFFTSQESGGTIISTALEKMLEIARARYPVSDWNIYVAQASDGDDYANDPPVCRRLLEEAIMPMCQYYAYVEILDERESDIFKDPDNGAALWRAYRQVDEKWPGFAMKRIARRADIYPVFRELFARNRPGLAA